MKIIAEIGSNWNTLQHCMESIAQAKAAGADAVKFQLYDYVALYGPRFVTPSPNLMGSLPTPWLPKLAEKAKACGIEFMCTAFSPELVEAVDPYVETHKVASAELTHVRLLEAIKATGKPVYVSTGAHGFPDIGRALEILGRDKVVLMHCVANYPAKATNLGRIKALRDAFEVPVGYSDHSLSCDDIPQAAKYWGAVVLEKHVTAFPELETPDQPHSLTMDQFKYMVDYLRGEKLPTLAWMPEEDGMIRRHNRRLIATRDIAEGEALEEGDNFGIYRSLKDDTRALSAWHVDEVHGMTAKRTIKAGDGISPQDI